MTNPIVQKAIEVCGSQRKLAAALEKVTGEPVSQQRISNWLNRDNRLPPEFAIPVEEVTGGAVRRSEWSPDVFRSAA